MKTSFLKKLDPFLSYGVCLGIWTLNRLGLKARIPQGPRRVFILRPGGLGDLVAADMAWAAWCEEKPELRQTDITWLIETRSEPWAAFRNLSYICYDKKPARTLKRCWNHADIVINTEQYYGLTQCYALWSLAHGGKSLVWSTNTQARWAHQIVPYDWQDEVEALAFARLFSAANGGSGTVLPPELIEALTLRPRLKPPTQPPLVYLAGLQSPSRTLSVDTWVQLIKSWLKTEGKLNSTTIRFNLAAAPPDRPVANKIMDQFSGQANLFTGSFAETCHLVAASEKMLTIDGGAVHIASYFGVPTSAVFTSGRDSKWRPLAQGSSLLRRRDLSCQPCTKFGQVPPCPNQFACCHIQGIGIGSSPVSENRLDK